MTIHWKAAQQHFTVEVTVFSNLSVVDLALPGVKGFSNYPIVGQENTKLGKISVMCMHSSFY